MEISRFPISNGMNSKKLAYRIVFLICFIFLVNFSAMYLHWYSLFWYFDMPMHFLGGFWIALASLYLLKPKDFSIIETLKVLAIVFIIGSVWEAFEIIVNNTTAQNVWDWHDTFSDIFFDLAGGVVAVMYFFQRIFINTQNKL